MKGLRLALLIIALASLAAGCWSHREIESLAFVLGTGLDKPTDEDETIRLTVQIARPQDVAGGAPGNEGRSNEPLWVTDVTGRTVFDAVRNIRSTSPRALFWGHSRVMVIGEELAREGIANYLDFFVRDVEPRMTTWVMIAKDTTANDILNATFGLVDNPATALFDLTRTRAGSSESYVINLNHFLQRLQDEGVEPFASRVERRRAGYAMPPGVEQPPPADLPVSDLLGLRLTGLAVFKGDKLVGWLDERETRGFLWATGNTQSGVVVIPMCPDGTEKPISIELIERPHTSVRAMIQDGRPSISVKVRHEAVIGDIACDIDLNSAVIAKLEKELAKEVKGEIEAALERTKLLGSDIFGFGALFSRTHFLVWQSDLKDHWDAIFPELDVAIEVESFIRKSGLTASRFTLR